MGNTFSVNDVASLSSRTGVNHGDIGHTLGYSQVGIGAAAYHFALADTSTIDGMYTLPGQGGRWKLLDRNQREITLAGALPDTQSQDCSRELLKALKATGGSITIPPGNFRLASTVAYTGNVHLEGPGTLILNVPASYCLNIAGELRARDVTFRGSSNGVAVAIFVNGPTAKHRFDHCRFLDFDSVTQCCAVQVYDCYTCVFADCEFSNLIALANNVGGDRNGVARAIIHSGNSESFIVLNCRFHNISNRTSDHGFAAEDADAIHFQPVAGKVQQAAVINCDFTQVGRRAVKVQGTRQSNYTILGNRIESSFRDLPDSDQLDGNGLYACVGFMGGSLVLQDNTLTGGACSYFVTIGGSETISAIVEHNLAEPQPRAWVNKALSTFCLVTSGATNLQRLVVNRNTANGWYYFVRNTVGCGLLAEGNTAATFGTATSELPGGQMQLGSNQLTRHPYSF